MSLFNAVVAESPFSFVAAPSDAPTKAASGRVRLGYLDGVRGLAALFVVLCHCWQFVVTHVGDASLPGWFRVFTIFKLGTFAVSVFIVLSGYCLMLPVARTAELTLSGGLSGFFRRRARRILPPYMACLLLSLGMPLLFSSLSRSTGTQWDIALPALTPGSIISHFTLTHNLFSALKWAINPPLWSVALEWQIYFVFALALLPTARRFGLGAALGGAFILGVLPLFLGGAFIKLWMLFLFSLGMAGAMANFAPGAAQWRPRIASLPLIPAACCLLVTAVLVELKIPSLTSGPLTDMPTNILVGLAMLLFLVASTEIIRSGGREPLLVRIAELPLIRRIGDFSYSLYLIHFPLLALFFIALLRLNLTPVLNFAVLCGVFMPLLLLIAYGFHRVFERPFMTR